MCYNPCLSFDISLLAHNEPILFTPESGDTCDVLGNERLLPLRLDLLFFFSRRPCDITKPMKRITVISCVFFTIRANKRSEKKNSAPLLLVYVTRRAERHEYFSLLCEFGVRYFGRLGLFNRTSHMSTCSCPPEKLRSVVTFRSPPVMNGRKIKEAHRRTELRSPGVSLCFCPSNVLRPRSKKRKKTASGSPPADFVNKSRVGDMIRRKRFAALNRRHAGPRLQAVRILIEPPNDFEESLYRFLLINASQRLCLCWAKHVR